ncbi:MAG TPA: FAD-binding oxidoreductase [Chitinophagales bacterium]|nr:FAD-binding oxidoreductase [Chitinophagales bacterium]
MKVDFIIVGQGIAGSMLARMLTQAGKKVLIVDEFNPNSASRVASGIINPVTGKRLVKSWRIEELLPFAVKAYHELEKELRISALTEKIICRIFSNKEDMLFYRQKKELNELAPNVQPLKNIPDCFRNTPYGGIEIKGVYQLDYPLLLSAMRKFFLQMNMLLEEKLEHDKIHRSKGKIFYKDIEALKIIFCEGSGAVKNPFFSRLPFSFAKGETISVKMPGFPEDCIWHKGIFILPMGKNLFRVGATYEWSFSDEKISSHGKEELTARLRKAVNLPFEVIGQQAAIRPTVADRRPLIGLHPEFPEIGLFNGLGTKGATLAPFFANQLAQFLVNATPLDNEVSVRRFLNPNLHLEQLN